MLTYDPSMVLDFHQAEHIIRLIKKHADMAKVGEEVDMADVALECSSFHSEADNEIINEPTSNTSSGGS